MKLQKLFNIFSFFIIPVLTGLSSQAQHLDSLMYEFGTKYPQEKVYLQYDKPYYNPGETIWFKGYITTDNAASALSKTLYAELINDKGQVLQKKVMPIIESGAASFFDLPDTLTTPVVYVRAYTSWMLNFDATLLYTKSISVITNTKKNNNPSPVYTLNFFPEGGDFVNSVESLVAFKATDQYGNPVNVNGDIVNTKGTKLVSFSSVHNGMGTFAFTPSAGESYKAIWKDKKAVAHETTLPAVKSQGVVLSVVKSSTQLLYNLKRPANAEKAFTSFYVIGQMQQQVVYSAAINMTARTEITAAVPTDSLSTGILQLTIFNAADLPVAERICFINHNNYYFNTDLHAIELNLNKRKHNTLQVDVGGNIVTNLSISVTDESLSTSPDNRDNIYSNLLLSSDLKGTVYNPAYYFSSEEDSVAQQLDLVMLTNGWRRFKWDDVIQKKWPKITYQPDDFITIAGNVYGPSTTLLKGKEIMGILKTKTSDDLFTMPVTPDGAFAVTGLLFYDTAKLYYQFNLDKDKQLTSISSFTIKTSYANAATPVPAWLNEFNPASAPDTSLAIKNKRITKLLRDQFAEGNKVKSLETITLRTRVKTLEEKLDEKYTSGLFTGGDATMFDIAGEPAATTALSVLHYLQARVAGLTISIAGTNATAKWRGSDVSFYLNESSANIDQIEDIRMSDVALIKVFHPPFFGPSTGGAGGAVAVYLKKGAERNSADVKGLDFVRLNGYSTVREFYSPDYEKLGATAPANDYRSTLYWNPFLLMDKTSRRIKIPFYNNDNCKRIRVVIEGLNAEGRLSREEKVFE